MKLKNFKDLRGKKFCRLTVIDLVSTTPTKYNCICDCGNKTIVFSTNLIRETTKSCGCLRIEKTKISNTTHGKTNHRLYSIHRSMLARCYAPNHPDYHTYGGRGITVCKRWHKFESFYKWAINNGYDPLLSIDRINNSKGYSPSNCRFATDREQALNRRRTIWLEFEGKRLCLKDWSVLKGIHYSVLQRRVYAGKSTEEILNTNICKK